MQSRATRRHGRRRWRALAALGLVMNALALSGCTLYSNTQFTAQPGQLGTYVYVHVLPTSQIMWVYNDVCRRDMYGCVAPIMRGIRIGNGFAQDWWNDAWSHPYSISDANAALYDMSTWEWITGGQYEPCLVMLRLYVPYNIGSAYGLVWTDWQVREYPNDGCNRGQFARQ